MCGCPIPNHGCCWQNPSLYALEPKLVSLLFSFPSQLENVWALVWSVQVTGLIWPERLLRLLGEVGTLPGQQYHGLSHWSPTWCHGVLASQGSASLQKAGNVLLISNPFLPEVIKEHVHGSLSCHPTCQQHKGRPGEQEKDKQWSRSRMWSSKVTQIFGSTLIERITINWLYMKTVC